MLSDGRGISLKTLRTSVSPEYLLRARKDFRFACVDIDVIGDKEISQSARFIFTVLCTFIITAPVGQAMML